MSETFFKSLSPNLKIKNGQKIKLIQVTGSTVIAGYVLIEIFFDTPDGPVSLEVEAYVVKGMSTPFILGNDFADQYDLSILRHEGQTSILLGESNRTVLAQSSTSPSLLDTEGHAFQVRVMDPTHNPFLKNIIKIKQQQSQRKSKARSKDPYVRAAKDVIIPPETSKAVPISTTNWECLDTIYAERVFHANRNSDDIFAAPDTLVRKEDPFIHISNFSKNPIRISAGLPLANLRSPDSFLDKIEKTSKQKLNQYEAHAQLIRSMAESLGKVSSSDDVEHNPGDEPLEGGPKTSETPFDSVSSDKLLDAVDISPSLSPEQRIQMERVILSNAKAFGLDGRLGSYPAHVHIRFKEDTHPITLPPFPLSPAKREVMNKQIDDWIQLGAIEPSISPWGAPAFVVYRQGKARVVIDFRKLNDRVIPDEFPLPKQDDILQALTGSVYLSTFDALSGFTQLEMAQDSKEPLAFRSHRGLYQFKRMPLGYRNGPSVFQRVMQNILAPFLWIFALVYIDDIVVYSKTFEEHLEQVGKVLAAISKSGITLSPPKCHLGFQSLKLLGQKVSRLGLSTHKEKVDAILQLAEPRTVKELQSFLGMMVYFSAYIPFYAWIVAPLFKLLRKGTPWVWGEIEQEAFDLSKKVLTNSPVRAYAMPGLGYRLYSNACDYGLAAILQQIQPIKIGDLKGTKVYERLEKAHKNKEKVPVLVTAYNKDKDDLPKITREWSPQFEDTIVDVERVIAYWSRTLKSAERNYSPTEREALALKEGLIKFQTYIEGERIDAITDHAALTWSKTFQNVNRRLLSWGTTFTAYPDLHIVHRAGKVHSNVDPISRLRRRVPRDQGPESDQTAATVLKDELEPDPLSSLYDELSDKFESRVLHLASAFQHEEEYQDTSLQTEIHLPSDLDTEDIPLPYVTSSSFRLTVFIAEEETSRWVAAYKDDPLLWKIINAVRTEENPLIPQYPQYYLSDDGLLYFEDWEGRLRLCVPKNLKAEILKEDHETLIEGAHSGYHRAYNRIASTYYWPRMSRDIKAFVTSCDICQKMKTRKHKPYGLLCPIPIPSKPFEVVSMNFIPELPMSALGHDNVLVIVDKLTKFVILVPTTVEINKEETARLFYSLVISKFGIPRQIITDRDSRWAGDFWEEICRQLNMKRALTTAYHPQADGQTEIMNQILETALRCYVNPERDDWDTYLDSFALSYNNTPHSSTGFPPAFLLFGFNPTTGSNRLQIPSEEVDRNIISDNTPETIENNNNNNILNDQAVQLVAEFEAYRSRAKDALLISQTFQQRGYNRNRLTVEFDTGDLVLVNLHSLRLLSIDTGRGKKLLPKFDGPFEVTEKFSPVTYRLRLNSNAYNIHPIINIAHLEPYRQSPSNFGPRKLLSRRREHLEEPEWEVEKIVGRTYRKRGSRRIPYYRVRFVGYGPEHDEWLSPSQVRNAPEMIREWVERNKSRGVEGKD